MAAPRATASSGFTPPQGFWWKRDSSASRIMGMRVMPPTGTTASIWAHSSPSSRIKRSTTSIALRARYIVASSKSMRRTSIVPFIPATLRGTRTLSREDSCRFTCSAWTASAADSPAVSSTPSGSAPHRSHSRSTIRLASASSKSLPPR